MSTCAAGSAGISSNSPRENARSGQYRTLKAGVQPEPDSPMTIDGRAITGSRSVASTTTCSASHLVCSYVLRNCCPATSWRSRNVPL